MFYSKQRFFHHVIKAETFHGMMAYRSFFFLYLHSTKYIGGHSDITAGSLTLSSQQLYHQCYELRKFLGGCMVSIRDKLGGKSVICAG